MNKDALWYTLAGLCLAASLLLVVFSPPGRLPTAQAVAPPRAAAATTPQSEAILAALRLMPLPSSFLYLPVILR